MMALRALLRWLVFTGYVALFFAIPLSILWGLKGLAVAAILWLTFLLGIGWNGPERVRARLGAAEVSLAEYPFLFALTREYSRRLGLTPPRLLLVESPALNLGVFGYTRGRGYLFLTRGALNSLPRECLGALIARELTYLAQGECFCETWLSQCLALVDRLIASQRPRGSHSMPRYYSFNLFFRQLVLYPLCLVPSFLLQRSWPPAQLDELSLKISRDPRGLAEGLRRLQARFDRVPLPVPFSTRHLFLQPPAATDPVARILFGSEELGARIRGVEKFFRAVAPQGA